MALTQRASCCPCGSIILSASGIREHTGSKFGVARVHLKPRRGQFLTIRAEGVNEKSSEVNEGASDSVEARKTAQEQQQEKPKRSPRTPSFAEALDFAETRSEADANLLENAREATRAGERMSREQYGALRRKIGGTYKDFFKDSVEVIGDYVDDGWVDKTCYICKKDASNDPRTKDSIGRYAHVACMEGKKKNGNFFTKLFGGQ